MYECVIVTGLFCRTLVASLLWVVSHVWMSNITCVNEPTFYNTCRQRLCMCVWVSRDTGMNESMYVCMNLVSVYEYVMWHVWICYVTRMNESCQTYKCEKPVRQRLCTCMYMCTYMCLCISVCIYVCVYVFVYICVHICVCTCMYICMCRCADFTCMNLSCHIYGCVMSHVQMRHVTRMNASCHTYVPMSRIHMYESVMRACVTYEWVSPQSVIWMSHSTYALIHKCDMTDSYMYSGMTHSWNDAFMSDTCTHSWVTHALTAQEWTNCTLVDHERSDV